VLDFTHWKQWTIKKWRAHWPFIRLHDVCLLFPVLQTKINFHLILTTISVGSICYSVMISVGEMIAFLPISGGFIKFAERFVDPSFSFALGWNYWYNWLVYSYRRFIFLVH
jgi:hypothetical protein